MARKLILGVILLLILAPSLWSQSSFDLRNWNFEEEGLYALNGDWDFFPYRFLSPAAPDQAPESLKVPGAWNTILGSWGYGTYRTKIVLTEEIQYLGLDLRRIRSSYRLYINGELFHQVGVPGETHNQEEVDGEWGIYVLPPLSGEVELVLQLSNHQQRSGGIMLPVYIGTMGQLRIRETRWALGQTVLLGIFFSFSLYHLMLFLFRSSEKATLYFGIFAFLSTIRIALVESSYLVDFYQLFDNIPWQILRKLEYLSFYGMAMVFVQYFYHLFPQDVDRRLGYIVHFFGIPYFFLTIFFDLRIFSLYLAFAQFVVLLWCFYAGYVLLKQVRRKLMEGRLLFWGFVFFLVTVILDMLISIGILPILSVFAPIGFFVFLFCQSAILSRRLAFAFNREEKLSADLNTLLQERRQYQELLEQRVEDRTAELERAVDHAENASRAKGDFLARMSHEIRTPLNGIMGFAEIVSSCQDLKDVKNYSDTIISESEKLLILINQLLDLSRIEAGGFHLELNPFLLSDVLDPLAQIFLPQTQSKNIDLVVEYPKTEEVYLIGDAYRLRQILINLLGNAIKFTQKGRITLKVSSTYIGNEYRGFLFSVKDTGKGIAPEKLATIFDSFVQEDTSITREYGGSGLGTAISKSFVELMGGHIGVESQPSVGTTFWFQLDFPLSRKEGQRNKAKKKGLKVEQFQGKRILVAEDYPANQEVIINHLKKSGVDLTMASNGLEACQFIEEEKEKFDLVLLDIHMPHKNGYEVADFIRQDLKLSVPIVGLTADGYKQVQDRCRALGMNDFLTKPIRKAMLMECLGRWLFRD